LDADPLEQLAQDRAEAAPVTVISKGYRHNHNVV
jgi:hypothetical protein